MYKTRIALTKYNINGYKQLKHTTVRTVYTIERTIHEETLRVLNKNIRSIRESTKIRNKIFTVNALYITIYAVTAP